MRWVHPVLATGAGPAAYLKHLETLGAPRRSCRMKPPLMMAPWQPCGRQAQNAASATKQPNAFSVERSSYVRLDSGDPTTQSSSSAWPHGNETAHGLHCLPSHLSDYLLVLGAGRRFLPPANSLHHGGILFDGCSTAKVKGMLHFHAGKSSRQVQVQNANVLLTHARNPTMIHDMHSSVFTAREQHSVHIWQSTRRGGSSSMGHGRGLRHARLKEVRSHHFAPCALL